MDLYWIPNRSLSDFNRISLGSLLVLKWIYIGSILDAPKSSKVVPGSAHVVPGGFREVPMWPHEAARWCREAPGWSQDAPIRVPGGPGRSPGARTGSPRGHPGCQGRILIAKPSNPFRNIKLTCVRFALAGLTRDECPTCLLSACAAGHRAVVAGGRA